MSHLNSPKPLFLFFIVLGGFFSCSSPSEQNSPLLPAYGRWAFNLDLKKASLPFEAEIIAYENQYILKIFNAEEEIIVDEVQLRNDSFIVNLPVFESSLCLKITHPDSMHGVWVNYYKGSDYKIKVRAEKSEVERFAGKKVEGAVSSRLFPKYKVQFSPNKKQESLAIGLFETRANRVYGTFATETGDYRFLEGALVGDSLFLSTFDGSNAYYFAASVKDSLIDGVFYSGIHHEENWIAKANNTFELRSPDSLTYLTSDSSISFRLKNGSGEEVRLSDGLFDGKVKLIQIMGSWCPNCLDESLYFKELKEKYASRDFEIIAIAFERTKSEERAFKNLNRLSKNKGLNYPILLGGYSREQHPTDLFPMLTNFMSYPTTLYLDKENNVRKIYTGFYGPGTGSLYNQYKKETEAFIEELLSE